MRDNLDFTNIHYTWNLFTQPLDQALHQSYMAVNNARLHVLYGVFAQGRARWSHIYTIKTRGSTTQRLGRDHQARRNRSTQEITLGRDHIKRCRSTECDDDCRTTIDMMGR